jgi:hypothetical protein
VLSRGGKILEHIDGDTQLQVNDDVILFGKEIESRSCLGDEPELA